MSEIVFEEASYEDAEVLKVDKETMINLIQMAYEAGYKQRRTVRGFMPNFGETLLLEVCKSKSKPTREGGERWN